MPDKLQQTVLSPTTEEIQAWIAQAKEMEPQADNLRLQYLIMQRIVHGKANPATVYAHIIAGKVDMVKLASLGSAFHLVKSEHVTAPDCEITVATTSHEPDPDAIT